MIPFGASDVEIVPSSGTSTRRSSRSERHQAGTTTTGLSSDVITSRAVVPIGFPPFARRRAPTTTATTSGRPRPPRAVGTVGPCTLRSSSPAAAAAARAVRSPSSPTWRARPPPRRAGRDCPRSRAPARAAKLLSSAAITLLHGRTSSQPSSRAYETAAQPALNARPATAGSASISSASCSMRTRTGQPRNFRRSSSASQASGRCGSSSSTVQQLLSPRRNRRRAPATRPPIVARCTPPAVVPVRSSRSIRPASRSDSSGRVQPPCPREQRGVDRRRERAAVGGARLVEVEVRLERPGRDLVGNQVVEHQHVGLLDHLGARARARARAGGRRRSAGEARSPR